MSVPCFVIDYLMMCEKWQPTTYGAGVRIQVMRRFLVFIFCFNKRRGNSDDGSEVVGQLRRQHAEFRTHHCGACAADLSAAFPIATYQ